MGLTLARLCTSEAEQPLIRVPSASVQAGRAERHRRLARQRASTTVDRWRIDERHPSLNLRHLHRTWSFSEYESPSESDEEFEPSPGGNHFWRVQRAHRFERVFATAGDATAGRFGPAGRGHVAERYFSDPDGGEDVENLHASLDVIAYDFYRNQLPVAGSDVPHNGDGSG